MSVTRRGVVKGGAPAALTYDPAATGGTTTLTVDRDGNLVSQHVSIGGTATNCAGGRTDGATFAITGPWHRLRG